jgi:hypothetical protein
MLFIYPPPPSLSLSFSLSLNNCPHSWVLNNNCASTTCKTGSCSGTSCVQTGYTDSGSSYTAGGGNCCQSGTSTTPSCTYGSYRCNGLTVQRCLGNCPHSWQNQGTCSIGDPCQEPTCNSGAAWASATTGACGQSSAAHGYKSGCATGKWCLPSTGLRMCLNIDACGDDGHVANPVTPRGICTDRAAPATGYTSACYTGYDFSGLNQPCTIDRDGCVAHECKAGARVDNSAVCTDWPAISPTHTAYTCSCHAGWESVDPALGVRPRCEDVDG